jgi:hypothetical protein
MAKELIPVTKIICATVIILVDVYLSLEEDVGLALCACQGARGTAAVVFSTTD